MNVCVNDQPRDVPEGMTVAGLLDLLRFHPRRVAVERNQQLLRRGEFDRTALAAGDRLEIVTIVGGG